MLSFHVKFVQTDRQTDRQLDGQTDRRTTVKQYTPDLSIKGHKKEKRLVTSISSFSKIFKAVFLQTIFEKGHPRNIPVKLFKM